MSQAEQRRADQAAYDRDEAAEINERPAEPPVPAPTEGWSGTCAGWRVGVHERTRENRLAGIYRCRWCGQTFDPPNAAELEVIRQRSLAYNRPYRVRR